MKSCLNLAALIHLDLEEQLSVSAAAGFSFVGLRMTNIEKYLAGGRKLSEIRMLLERYGLTAVELNFFPNWADLIGDDLERRLDDFRRFNETANELACSMLVVPTSTLGSTHCRRAAENYAHLCHVAEEHGTLAVLEFIPWSDISDIGTAWDIVQSVNSKSAGLVFDTFHYFKGGSRLEDLQAIPREKIFMVHLCDITNEDTDLITLCRECRVLPGEGVFDFSDVLKELVRKGYDGYYALEIFNRDYPKQDPMVLAGKSKKFLDGMMTS